MRLRHGKLCKGCAPGRCEIGDGEEFVCPSCNGKRCEECGHAGRFEVNGCPNEYIGADIRAVLNAEAMYVKGIPPINGGSLDQDNQFNEACQFIWNQESALLVET